MFEFYRSSEVLVYHAAGAEPSDQCYGGGTGNQTFYPGKKTSEADTGGSVLYNRLPKVLSDYAEAVEDAKHANSGYEGELRIGFLDIYDISELFDDVIREFREAYEQIAMSLERFALGELPARLAAGDLDLILTYGFSLYDKPDLVTVNVQKFDSCIMLNQNHPLALQETVALADLKDERFIQLGPKASEEGFRYITNLCARCGIHPDFLLVEKMEDVMLWVQTGNGVAITSDRTIEGQNPHVVLRNIDMPEAKNHNITMAWRKNNYNPAIAIFMEMLEKKLTKI